MVLNDLETKVAWTVASPASSEAEYIQVAVAAQRVGTSLDVMSVGQVLGDLRKHCELARTVL